MEHSHNSIIQRQHLFQRFTIHIPSKQEATRERIAPVPDSIKVIRPFIHPAWRREHKRPSSLDTVRSRRCKVIKGRKAALAQ